jgi:hypothetical protein
MKKTIVVLIALAVVAVLLAVILRRPGVPAYATVAALERHYPDQINRLRALTQSEQPYAALPPEEMEADNALFSLPEILEVRLEADPNHIRTLGHTFDWQKSDPPRTLSRSAGSAAVTRYDFKLQDGTRVSAVEYRAAVHGPRGDTTISILFNLAKLPRD